MVVELTDPDCRLAFSVDPDCRLASSVRYWDVLSPTVFSDVGIMISDVFSVPILSGASKLGATTSADTIVE